MAELTTRRKIALARAARYVVMIGRRVFGAGDHALAWRRGIRWNLDLREGIDFAIFLLGGFELRTLRLYARLIRSGDTVFDIGANIGAHTLPFAQLVGPMGRVVAFEPTKYAFAKLQRNLALNPELALRVSANQVALLECPSVGLPPKIYSSWPLQETSGLDKIHGGRLQGTEGSRVATLDQAAKTMGLKRLDFIKLDVDGHEPEVLCGGLDTIGRFRPRILMEWAPYIFEGKNQMLDTALKELKRNGYRARLPGSAKISDMPLDRRSPAWSIAEGASVNLLLEVS